MRVWHPGLRTRLTKEHLYYWRFSTRSFDSLKMAKDLDEFLTSYSEPTSSFAIYDTFGSHDVLLRCWLPVSLSPEQFEVDLLGRLQPYGAEDAQYLRVDDVLRHQAWHNGMPLSTDLSTPNQRGIETVEYINSRASSVFERRLNGLSGEEFKTEVERLENEEFETRGDPLIAEVSAPLNLSRRGIRFCLDFSHPRAPLTQAQRRDINRRLTRVCDSVNAQSRIDYKEPGQISLYSGFGTFTTHLIVAQAPDSHFYGFARMLLQTIYDDGIPEAFSGMKTTTNVYSSRYPLMIRETLRTRRVRSFTEADLEDTTENENLELKSSVWLNANALYSQGKHTSFEGGADAIGKAICGMLNRNGGVIVVGVGETSRMPDASNANGAALSASLPRTPNGELVVLGVEEEYSNADARVGDWDAWMRKAQDAVTRKITPDPMDLLCVKFEPLRLSSKYERRTLGLIIIDAPRDRTTWFYFENQFYMRAAGRTLPLRGADMDTYRSALLERSFHD